MKYGIIIIVTLTLLRCNDISEEYYLNEPVKPVIEYDDKNTPNGLFINFNIDSILVKEEYYLNGRKPGVYKLYDENEILETKANCYNGVANNIVTDYHEKGKPKNSAWYIEGFQNGVIRILFKDEKLDRKKVYEKGIHNGSFKSYFRNGKLSISAKIQNDTKTYNIVYDSLGNVIEENSSNCLCDLTNLEQYKPKIIISNKDYLIIDSVEIIKLRVKNISNSCLSLSVSNAVLYKSKFDDEYKVIVNKTNNNKVRFHVSMLCDTIRISLGTIDKEIRAN